MRVWGETGKLACQRGQLIKGIVYHEVLWVPRQSTTLAGSFVSLSLYVWDLMAEVIQVVWFMNHHGRWAKVYESPSVPKDAGLFLQHPPHLLVAEGGSRTLDGHHLVLAPAVV